MAETGAAPAKKDKEPLLFAAKDEALAEFERWQRMLPLRKSAYRPSGKMPAAGWISLPLAGVTLGALLGALFGSLLVVAGEIMSAVSFYISHFLLGLPAAELLTTAFDIVYFIGAFTVFGVLCAAPGIGSIGVAGLARNFKSRNVTIQAATAVCAAIGGSILLWRVIAPGLTFFLIRIFPEGIRSWYSSDHVTPFPGPFILVDLYLSSNGQTLSIFITAAVSTVVALKQSIAAARGAKFCESCSQFMKVQILGSSSLDQTVAIVHAIETGTLKNCEAAVLDGDGPGVSTLYKCETCKAGYLEVNVSFLAKWPRANKKDKYDKKSKTWLAASKAFIGGDALATAIGKD